MSIIGDLITSTASGIPEVQNQAELARDAWLLAAAKVKNHVLLVWQNNPGKTLEEILARPDVKQSFSLPFEQAAQSAAGNVHEAWNAGLEAGQGEAADQLKAIGLRPPGAQQVSEGTLNGVLGDLDKNADLASAKMTAAVQTSGGPSEASDRIDRIAEDMSRRAHMSTTVAGSTAASLQKEKAYAAASKAAGLKIRKMWVTHFGPGTCPTCAAMHGTAADLGKPFPSHETLHPKWKPPKPYLGILMGPPRHPNCRCSVIPITEPIMQQNDAPTSATMHAHALTWWQTVKKALGLS